MHQESFTPCDFHFLWHYVMNNMVNLTHCQPVYMAKICIYLITNPQVPSSIPAGNFVFMNTNYWFCNRLPSFRLVRDCHPNYFLNWPWTCTIDLGSRSWHTLRSKINVKLELSMFFNKKEGWARIMHFSFQWQTWMDRRTLWGVFVKFKDIEKPQLT